MIRIKMTQPPKIVLPRTSGVVSMANARGPRGIQGPVGPGASDPEVAAYIDDPASDVRASLSATFGPVVTPEAYGAVGDGVTDDAAAIQSMFTALKAGGVPRFVRFREGADYYLASEVEVTASYVAVQAHGAKFTGPVAGTPEGGLVTIVDRADTTRTVEWTSWFGGHFVPKNALDNALSAVSADQFLWGQVTADLTTGQRGFAVQTNATFTSLLRNGQIVACASKGGVNGVNIDSTGVDRIRDISVRGFRAVGAGVALRVSAGGPANTVSRINVQGFEAVNCPQGISWYHAADSTIDGFDVSGLTTGRGIDSQYASGAIRNGRIEGAAASNMAMAFSNATGLNLSQIAVEGTFTVGLYNAATDLTARDISLKDCTLGLQTNSESQRAVYSDFVFENVATKVNAYRAGDVYRNFAERTGTTVTDISRHGQSAIDVPVFGYFSQTNWSTLGSKGIISSGAQNAAISFKITPGAGTYTLRLGHVKSTNRGIYTVTVDGVSVGTIDGYDAATLDAVSELTGIAINNGEHTLTLTMATKNASASSYFGAVWAACLVRTA